MNWLKNLGQKAIHALAPIAGVAAAAVLDVLTGGSFTVATALKAAAGAAVGYILKPARKVDVTATTVK